MPVQSLPQHVRDPQCAPLVRQGAPLVHQPLNIAHRGASGEAPENTLVAFELALRQGADGIEFDVHFSADGVPFIIHDARLERTTSGRGRVNEHRSAALRRLNAGAWFNRRFPSRARQHYAGARIPLLSEGLSLVRERKCRAFLELKDTPAGFEARVLEEIEKAGVRTHLTVISFDVDTLRRVRQLDSRIGLGLDASRRFWAIRRAKALGAVAILPHWAIASPRLILGAHRNSLHVFAWTVDEPRWMHRRILDGADGLITNFPARLEEVRSSLFAG